MNIWLFKKNKYKIKKSKRANKKPEITNLASKKPNGQH